ncbi:hypothetical protein GIS00_16145 [Nakamurella sp. YIM 132087]|uniref:Excalibur calcium-binding domain-containing protein n=2 Tax=Nakamurella alba TaxID=2665158 RepID=A0A7K1FMS1_9ACTN|nr:hypothetical protein [Nakamurella alba]
MVGGATAAPVPAASVALPTCAVTAQFPARLSIRADVTQLPVRLTGCEGRFEWATVDLSGPSPLVAQIIWNRTRVATATIGTWDLRPGVYATSGGYGHTNDAWLLRWKHSTTTIKYASYAGTAASRTSGVTSVTVDARRFAAGKGFIAYANRVVGVQSAPSAAGPWTTAGYVQVAANGKALFRTTSGAQYFRTWFGDSPSFFGATSAPAKVVQKAAPKPPVTAPKPPVSTPAPTPAPSVTYANCTDVWNTIGRPIRAGEPGYSRKLDRDGDGVGCESRP